MAYFYAQDGRKHYRKLREASPENFRAFDEFNGQVFHKESALSEKVKELIAIAVAHTTHCPYCIETHVKNAHKAGASSDEIAEAIFVAVALQAGAGMAHSTIAMATLEELEKKA